jgi:hypothetical protein
MMHKLQLTVGIRPATYSHAADRANDLHAEAPVIPHSGRIVMSGGRRPHYRAVMRV